MNDNNMGETTVPTFLAYINHLVVFDSVIARDDAGNRGTPGQPTLDTSGVSP